MLMDWLIITVSRNSRFTLLKIVLIIISRVWQLHNQQHGDSILDSISI